MNKSQILGRIDEIRCRLNVKLSYSISRWIPHFFQYRLSKFAVTFRIFAIFFCDRFDENRIFLAIIWENLCFFLNYFTIFSATDCGNSPYFIWLSDENLDFFLWDCWENSWKKYFLGLIIEIHGIFPATDA